MAADGYSRTMMGEKFGVFACQGGPGAENSYGGIAQAFADSVPIMFIPDGIPLYNSDVSPSFISSKNFIEISNNLLFKSVELMVIDENKKFEEAQAKAEKNRKELFSNYIMDGKKNWEKNKSHFKGSYISEDMAICSKLIEEN